MSCPFRLILPVQKRFLSRIPSVEMILLPVFLALAIQTPQGNPQSGSLFPEKPQEPAIAANFTSWHGWSYLQGAAPVWPKIYKTSGDWSDIQAHFTALKPGKPSVWHLKVVIFTRTEVDGKDANGVLREHRGSIESVQLAKIRIALLRFNAYVAAKFDGAVTIVPDVQVESEWMRDSGPDAFGPEFARRYFEARINGGSYEAEDKVFRGPFNSVLYVLPGSLPGDLHDAIVNDTPVAAVPSVPLGPDGIGQSFDTAFRAAWMRQVWARVAMQGYKSLTVTAPQTESTDPWPSVTNLDEVTPQTNLSHLNSVLELHPALVDPAELNVPNLPATDLKVAADPERGQVLKVTELSGFREGGVALPARADGAPIAKIDAAPTLSFLVKSTSKDPISIRLDSSDGKTAWISIGRDPILVTPMPGASVSSVPFSPDGKWQKIAVDLRQVAKPAGLVDVVRMAIEPSPNAKLAGKMQPDPVDYAFDEFKFSSDQAGPLVAPIAPSATSEDPEARALLAATAKAASPELAALLKDKSELVRLNATTAYIGFKDHTVEEQLISNSLDLDPSVAAAALAALMAEGSDTARAIVKRSVSVSLSDYAKTTAANLLAQTKDPKCADDVSRLLANRSWQAHVAAVEDLAQIPSPDSQTWRLAFIGMSDPAVKLAVTRNADATVDRVASALLWSAVNEPSDMVRAESYIKLIASPVAATKAEGYKGVRDDSRFVRKVVVAYLAAHPSEEHRGALRMAIADRSAQVRAAAIGGFAALEKGATFDEIGNVLDDSDSTVQLALLDFSKKRSMKLPQKTVDAMVASPDSRVSTAAKALLTGAAN